MKTQTRTWAIVSTHTSIERFGGLDVHTCACLAQTPQALSRPTGRRDRCRWRRCGGFARDGPDAAEQDHCPRGPCRPETAGRDRERRAVGVALRRPDRRSDRARLGNRLQRGRRHRHEQPRRQRRDIIHGDDVERQTLPGHARRLVPARRPRSDQGLGCQPQAGDVRRLVEAPGRRPCDRNRQPARPTVERDRRDRERACRKATTSRCRP